MQRPRSTLVALVLLLGALLVVGRLDLAGPAGPTPWLLQMSVIVTAAVMLLLPWITRLSPALLVGVVTPEYVIAEAYMVDGIALDGSPRFWQALIEVGLVALAVLMACRLGRQLSEIEDMVANVTIFDAHRVKTLEDAAEDIGVEMARARRHERPLTVTVLTVDPASISGQLHQIVRDIQQRMLQRYVLSGLARLVAQTTRRGDLVVQDPIHQRVIIVSPETEPHQIDVLARRLHVAAQETLGIPLQLGVAAFPEAALTFEDLVERASAQALDELIASVPAAGEFHERAASARHLASDGGSPDHFDPLPAGD